MHPPTHAHVHKARTKKGEHPSARSNSASVTARRHLPRSGREKERRQTRQRPEMYQRLTGCQSRWRGAGVQVGLRWYVSKRVIPELSKYSWCGRGINGSLRGLRFDESTSHVKAMRGSAGLAAWPLIIPSLLKRRNESATPTTATENYSKIPSNQHMGWERLPIEDDTSDWLFTSLYKDGR